MRIDKFLWAIRVYKTRSEAAEACRTGKVRIGQDLAKAAKEIKPGDTVTVSRSGITYSYKVLQLLPNRVGAAKVPEYVLDVTSPEEKEKLALQRAPSFERRDPRTGRPTKRERREIDRFKDYSGEEWL
ncbi:MAG: RNA-binding S4 domain-containing protein [Lentimicrobiaceae bacterium]|nr:RNA-binding S4 domain-containing protein [Lentimicrobiaceae bacterium]